MILAISQSILLSTGAAILAFTLGLTDGVKDINSLLPNLIFITAAANITAVFAAVLLGMKELVRHS